MSDTCGAAYAHLMNTLGSLTCDTVRPVVDLRNPFHLSNWTMPVLELLIIGGAVAALVHAVQRRRRHGDSANLAVWFGSIVYLLVTEPPLYFPRTFHIDGAVGTLFAHNVFTVQFLYDRLPLYIVALYPALACLAYEIVRSLGVFRRNIVLGAVCVGFVHHLFYEIFDQLGPQLRWWIWNPDSKLTRPMLASVPLDSVFLFATVGPAALTLLVRFLVGRRTDRGDTVHGWSLVGRTVLCGILTPVLLAVCGIPASAFGGSHPHYTAQAVVYAVCIALFAVVAIPVLVQEWRRTRTTPPSDPDPTRWYAPRYGPVYLAVFVVLWATALPAYMSAHDGITADGTPIGSLPYASACAVLAATTLVAVATAHGHAPGIRLRGIRLRERQQTRPV